jgi:hypothetical protein
VSELVVGCEGVRVDVSGREGSAGERGFAGGNTVFGLGRAFGGTAELEDDIDSFVDGTEER